MSIISLRNVSLSFGDREIVKNVNLELRSGESMVIMGPSGSGKTSLLKIMAGLLKPSSGEVFYKQQDISELDSKTLAQFHENTGMLFQKNALFDSMSCLENIVFPLREMGRLSFAEGIEKASSYLEAVGLSHAKQLMPDEISGGMQKRLGIARAMALEPELLLYDDPTAGLDPITSKKIVELINSIHRMRNNSIVTVTNDVNRAYQLADRIAVIMSHELIVTGTPEETRNFPDQRINNFINGHNHSIQTEVY